MGSRMVQLNKLQGRISLQNYAGGNALSMSNTWCPIEEICKVDVLNFSLGVLFNKCRVYWLYWRKCTCCMRFMKEICFVFYKGCT